MLYVIFMCEFAHLKYWTPLIGLWIWIHTGVGLVETWIWTICVFTKMDVSRPSCLSMAWNHWEKTAKFITSSEKPRSKFTGTIQLGFSLAVPAQISLPYLSILRFKLRLLFFSKYVILAFQSIWSLINRLPEISLILWKKHPKKSSLECWLTTRTISGQIFSPSEPRFTCLLNECNKTLLIRVLWRVNEILPVGHPYYHHRIL